MKKKYSMKLRVECLALSLVIALVLMARTVSAGTPSVEEMMGEGIPYENTTLTKSYVVNHDLYADMEATMSEGIVYSDNVVADNTILIKLDHKKDMPGMGACVCGDPSSLNATQTDNLRQKALETKPSAGKI